MGKKGGGSENVTMRLDPYTQRYVNESRRMAGEGARTALQGPGLFGPTMGQYNAAGQIAGAGQSGLDYMNTLMGQAGGAMQNLGWAMGPMQAEDLQRYFDPYQSQVIDAAQSDFGRQRDIAMNQAAQQATRAGAFGGNRSAVLQAEALNDVNRAEASMLSGLRSQGFGNAMQNYLADRARTGQLALGAGQLGLGAGQAGSGFELARGQAGLGAQEMIRGLRERAGQSDLYRYQQALQLRNLGLGPFGQNQTASGGGGNWFGSALGGAAVGSAFGVPGALIGGGIGALGGLF